MTSEVSQSFDQVVGSSERRLLRVALMLSGSAHTAEDLVQSVFARAHRRWSRIGALEHPEAYLRTMVVNEFLSWRRRLKNRELPTAELTETPTTEDIGARQAQRDAAWRLLATLPRRQRAVLVLRYYEDLPDDEIAAVLNCTASTVRSNAARGLASLRAELPADEEC
ncbi:RNA polymerase, sigma-24 subunit, ECF subfamily [Kribbella flavida DSM 17836]|uniref:RNA polymerase, sigma-24 subunit, ECF subfamily n=1 Tax=Kribbella flavida (strain DSM 17836 / JCM 10339 / NBRC 14399) TaxID=479435 RepID=D2PUR4_KRIFD|nr:SigE family RNA polymerase sigma factor [Kribbella flavida]ADB29582.1 RNA polymerase, sigma-24 subunit, ECF subfamily [Kribbella flavida DSM 17836]